MSMGTGNPRGGLQSEINVTPLVDVVLVLLIIFMVVTPILQMGLDVEVPPKVEVKAPPPDGALTQLVIEVRADGYYLNRTLAAKLQDPTLDALRDRVAEQMASRPEAKDKVVFINAEDQVSFEHAVRAMDAAHAGGARKIGFLTEAPKK
ncbi:MAG: biopolymer transporter ExbD [Thermoanaerobaculia bacterium]